MQITVRTNFDENYDEKCLETIVEQMNSGERPIYVCADGPSHEVRLDTICGEIVKGSPAIEDGQINYTIKMFGTDVGRHVKRLIADGGTEKFSVGLASTGIAKDSGEVQSDSLELVKSYIVEGGTPNIKEVE